MAVKSRFNPTFSYILFILILLPLFFSGPALGQQKVPGDVEEKLGRLTAEEKRVLEELFALAQSAAEMEKEETGLRIGIETLKQDIAGVQKAIAAEEKKYEQNQKALQHVLKSYQRMGPSSFLESLLGSGSLGEFLRKLTTLRDLARNTGDLLDSLQESKDLLAAQKAELEVKLASLQESRESLAESIRKTAAAKEELEEYLASLSDEREFYEGRLASMQQAWSELTQFFPEVSRKFSQIIKEAELPADALEIKLTSSGIKAAISAETINKIIADHGLDEMVCKFYPERVDIIAAQKELILKGTFVLENKVLKFAAEEGTFYGMALTPGNLEELFAQEELALDLQNFLENYTVRSLEISDNKLELLVVPEF